MYTTNQLISDAYYLSGIVSKDFELPTGSQETTGLTLLNGILDESSLDGTLIPFFTHIEFPAVIGQQTYNIPGLVELSALTFNINSVRFPMIRDTINRFFGTGRVDDIRSLPFHFYVEKALNSSNIYLYFEPDQTYPMKITGKFTIVDLAIGQDVSTLYPGYYVKWLKYRLAAEICEFYTMPLDVEVRSRLNNLERRLNKMVGFDLTISKYRMITRRRSDDYYGQANIGKGYTI